MWKIIRIDDNGDVRLLYNGTATNSTGSAAQVGTAVYNTMLGDAANVGYMQPSTTGVTYKMSSGTRTNWTTSWTI